MRWCYLCLVFVLASWCAGCGPSEYRGKSEAERAVVDFCHEQNAEVLVKDLERMDDVVFGEGTNAPRLEKYRVSVTSRDNAHKKATVFVFYDPNSGQVLLDDM